MAPGTVAPGASVSVPIAIKLALAYPIIEDRFDKRLSQVLVPRFEFSELLHLLPELPVCRIAFRH